MGLLAGLLFLLVLSIPLGIAIARANELFVLRWCDGELRVVRGRAPAELRGDIADVLARAAVPRVRLRGFVEQGRAALYVESESAGAPGPRAGNELPRETRQQLRNVIGRWPVAKIRRG